MLIRIQPGKATLKDDGETYHFVPAESGPVWIRAHDIARVRHQHHLDSICCVDVRVDHHVSDTHYLIEETPKAFAGRLNDLLREAVTPLPEKEPAPAEQPSNKPPKK